jgi:hypothetical protein
MATRSKLNKDGLLRAAPDSIFTFSGGFMRPLDPQPEDILIEDIAHALANQCRWTGHVAEFFSVAEHSMNVAKLVPEELRLTALLHDASEAYLADLARPIKKAPGLGEVYLEVEARLEAAIAERFGIDPDPLGHKAVKQADEQALWAEAKALLPVLGEQMPEPPDSIVINCLRPRAAKKKFLAAFKAYGGEE